MTGTFFQIFGFHSSPSIFYMDFALSKFCCQFLPTRAIVFNKPVSCTAILIKWWQLENMILSSLPCSNKRMKLQVVSKGPTAINCCMMFCLQQWTQNPSQCYCTVSNSTIPCLSCISTKIQLSSLSSIYYQVTKNPNGRSFNVYYTTH